MNDIEGGAGPASIRRQNLATVLRRLVEGGPRSRAGLAVQTGLTRATVSALVDQLAGMGLVTVADEHVRRGPGRPARPVMVRDDAIAVLGVQVEADHLRAVAAGPSGTTTTSRALDIAIADRAPAVGLDAVTDLVRQVLGDVADAGSRPVGVTIAVPGLVEPTGRSVLVAPNLGWRDVAVVDALEAGLGDDRRAPLAIRVDNEANLTALAELRCFGTPAPSPLLVVSAGIGVGAGLVVDGEVFRGAHGFGGELGHLVVEPGGALCRCGNHGCLETVVGRLHVARQLGLDAPAADWADRLVAAGADARADELLERVVEAIASALVSAIDLFDPAGIVLSGDLAPLAAQVAPQVRQRVDARVLGARWAHYEVRPSTLAADAVVTGAVAAGLDAILDDPLGAVGAANDTT